MDVGALSGAIQAGGIAAITAAIVAGFFVGLTPGAYLAGPAVLGYLNADIGGGRIALPARAAIYVLGTSLPMAAFGLLAGWAGDVVLVAVGTQIVTWYLLVAVVTGGLGLLLSGLLIPRWPAYLPTQGRLRPFEGPLCWG